MNPQDRTGPADTWNARTGVRCPGCRLGEFWGIPKHEPSCPEAMIWYALPGAAPAWLRKLADDLDIGPQPASPRAFEDRQKLWGLHYLVRATWHATLDKAPRFRRE